MPTDYKAAVDRFIGCIVAGRRPGSNTMSTRNLSKKDKTIQQLRNQISNLQRRKTTKVTLAVNSQTKRQIPVSQVPTWKGESKSLRVVQHERVATVTSSTTAGGFKADTYYINPADTTTFPWLSSIAVLFDKYKFHNLKFRFINNAPTTTAGNITMAVDFDTLDSTPTTMTGVCALSKFVSFAPYTSETLDVPVNGKRVYPYHYTADTNTSVNDPKSYNIGNFIIASEGLSSSSTILGYVVAEYDVELWDKNPN